MADRIALSDSENASLEEDYFYSVGSVTVPSESDGDELTTLSGILEQETPSVDDSVVEDRLGRFEIIGELGRGGFGSVYRAYDPQLEREVALKVPRRTMLPTRQELDRFLREARSAAMLRHPNICPVYEIGQANGRHFFVMAFIDGMTLGRKIKNQQQIDELEAARIVQSLARTLQFAHERGIVHRDIKPDNIMVDAETDELVIMDFGLATRSNANDARLTLSGQIIGTPAYMPPEQARGQIEAIGPAADIYSLGMILYELLTLSRPFTGSIADILVQILHENPPRPSWICPDVSETMDAICMKAISKNIADRFETMDEFARAIAQFLQATESTIVEIPIDEVIARQQAVSVFQQPAEVDEFEIFEDLKCRIEDSRRRGDKREVVKLLKQLADTTDPKAAYYVEWAKNELRRLQVQSDELRQQSENAWTEARSAFERHDYGRVIQLLQSIPDDFRSDSFDKLWQRTISLYEEERALESDINKAVVAKQYEEIATKVERMLTINPDHVRARKVSDWLQQQEEVQPTPPKPMHIPDFSTPSGTRKRRWIRWLLLLGVIAAGIYGAMQLVPTDVFSSFESDKTNETGIQIAPLPSTSAE